MSQKVCEVCRITLMDDYAMYGHVQGKKHAKNVEFAKEKKRLEECSIFVSPLPPSSQPNSIIKFFSEYGEIVSYKLTSKYAVIEFKDKNTVEYLLQNQIAVNKWIFNIQPRRFEGNSTRETLQMKPISSFHAEEKKIYVEPTFIDKIKEEINRVSTFEEQLKILMEIAQPDEKKLSVVVKKICTRLEDLLYSAFPRGRAIPFGSSVSGLSLVCSDLDIFYNINEPIIDDTNIQSDKNWTPKKIFRVVKSLLYRSSRIFSKIVTIPLAKTPLIKFHHQPTNTDCDVSFKHGLGVYNSEIIKFCLTLDPRIKPLIIIIKCWANRLQLSGSGKITNYPLVLLVFFYLQQSDIGLIPTIKQLQRQEEVLYMGWRVNYNRNFSQTTHNCNKNIPQLLLGFFKFYSEFDFTLRIIRPYNGTAPARIDYQKDFIRKYKHLGWEMPNLTAIACLQDPIQMDHNIISAWCPRLHTTFVTACSQTAELIDNDGQNTDLILPKIFKQVLKFKVKKPRNYQFIIRPGALWKFGLPDDFEEQNIENKEQIIVDNWFSTTQKLILKILVEVFKLNVEIEYDGTKEMKQIKLDGASDVHTKDHNKIVICCTGNHCIAHSRKSKRINTDANSSPIERESRISEAIVKEAEEKLEKSPMKFSIVIELKLAPNPSISTSIIDQLLTNPKFAETAEYMKFKIPIVIDKELKFMVLEKNIAMKKKKKI